MKILLVGKELNNLSTARLIAIHDWAESNGVEVEFVTQEECEQIKGQEYNFVVFNETLGSAYQEKPVKSKKGPQKPYYRAKERY